ncbi:MAG: DNA-protecting protein DprA [Acidobacteria bacterium]|nr:DNA-protecting protein DprA [Acidobacteriota bacterium]
MENQEEIRDWVALSFVTGVGSRTALTLIDRFATPAHCFRASPQELEAAGIKRDTIEQLKSSEPFHRADQELRELEKTGGTPLVIASPQYPALLRETYDPPIVLYSYGDLHRALARPAIAIVGSRRCSTYGRNVAEMLARELAGRGVTIVSGLARGIDSAAHLGALEGRGLTVAVIGTGLDEVYPKENKKLTEKIKDQGALITEFPLGTPPLPQHFPFRNRIISGMTLGVMVVEGAERSGSLITARMAYEQGREVFAVPGNITSSKSFGPNYLIKDGAKLVQTWRDVVEEFPTEMKTTILAAEPGDKRAEQLSMDEVALSENEKRVYSKLKSDDQIHIDELIALTKLSLSELLAALLSLEMSNRIKQLPGKYFARKL